MLKKSTKKIAGKLGRINKKRLFITVVTVVIAASMCTTVAFAVTDPTASTQTFVKSMLGILKIVLVAIGGGLGIWGIINLLEGYGNDNAGAKSQGMKQLMAGVGVAVVGIVGVPALQTFIDAWLVTG